jgi:hypothetical protein
MARVGLGSVRPVARDVALAFGPDSEVGGIVLVLDLWDFGAEKSLALPPNSHCRCDGFPDLLS